MESADTICKRRITERQITKPQITERQNLQNVELTNVEWARLKTVLHAYGLNTNTDTDCDTDMDVAVTWLRALRIRKKERRALVRFRKKNNRQRKMPEIRGRVQ